MLSSLLSVKVAVAAATATVTFGGISAAAYAGVLPAPAQRVAHTTIGAPEPGPAASSAVKLVRAHHRDRLRNRPGPCGPGLHPAPAGTAAPKPVAATARVTVCRLHHHKHGKLRPPPVPGPAVHPTGLPTLPVRTPLPPVRYSPTPLPPVHPTGPPTWRPAA